MAKGCIACRAPDYGSATKLLLKRGKVYSFRWQIPADLRGYFGRREVVRSLKTSCLWEAKAKASLLRYEVEQALIFLRYLVGMSKTEPVDEFREKAEKLRRIFREKPGLLDNSEVVKSLEVAERVYQKRLLEIYTILQHVHNNYPKATYQDVLSHKNMLLRGLHDIYRVSMTEEFRLAPGQESYLELMERVFERKGFFELVWIPDLDLFPGDYKKRFLVDMMNMLRDVTEKQLASMEPPPVKLPDYIQRSETVSSHRAVKQVHEEFLAAKAKSGLSDKYQREYPRFFSDWLDIVGDKDIKQISRSDVKKFVLSLASLPKRNLKAYKGLPASELLEMDIPEKEKVQPKTAHEGLKWLQGVFVYAIDQ